jgi:predicted nucleotidyltransferase
MEKERLLDIMKAVLEADEQVIWAYAYGSFVSGDFFRDIDIGIHVKAPEDNPFAISSELKTQLSLRARKEGIDLPADHFDVRILNHAPFTILKSVFKEGILLVDRDPDLRTDLIEFVALKYRECAGILAEASIR